MRCPRCGAVLRDDAEQCGFCGEKIVPVVSFEKPIIENRPRDEAFDVENTVQKAVPPVQENHDQSPMIIAIILLSGVLLAAVAVLVFYAVKNSQRAVVNVNASTVPTESVAETTPPASVATPAETETAEAPVSAEEEAAENTEPAPEESDSQETAAQTVYDDREYGGVIYRLNGNQAVVLKNSSPDSWIELPETVYGVPVVGISEEAFKDCAELEYIDLPEGVAWIGANAFNGCRRLREIVMPDTLVTIGDGSFNNVPSFSIVSHEDAYGHAFAEYHNLNWLEGESLVPLD